MSIPEISGIAVPELFSFESIEGDLFPPVLMDGLVGAE
jgi:hypothetical protein